MFPAERRSGEVFPMEEDKEERRMKEEGWSVPRALERLNVLFRSVQRIRGKRLMDG